MRPLRGIKVIEFSAIGPVPWCGTLLSDLGADVVRIDRPGSVTPDRDDDYTRAGRRSVTLDLKVAADRSKALEIAGHADLLIEGLRPGVMERLGLGPAECHRINPRLVYGRMTGWGQSGPLAERAGHDINYISLSGALHAIGPAEQPVPPINLVGDFGGGATFLVIGLLSALLDVRAGGKGQIVDAAMVDGSSYLMSAVFSAFASGAWIDQRAANLIDGAAPWYGVYPARDGKFVAVGAIEPQFYAQFLAGLGLGEGDLPCRDERANWPELRSRFAAALKGRTRDEWAAVFYGTDACVTPVLSISEAPSHPHNQARSTFARWKNGYVPMATPRLSWESKEPQAPSRRSTAEEALASWTKASPDIS